MSSNMHPSRQFSEPQRGSDKAGDKGCGATNRVLLYLGGGEKLLLLERIAEKGQHPSESLERGAPRATFGERET